MARVTASVVTWNSMESLPECLELVANQTLRDVEVIIVDNASADGVLDFLAARYPEVKVMRNASNEGFCKAHNTAMRLSNSEYFMPLNPDVFLTATYVERMVAALDRDSAAGIGAGKLYLDRARDVLDGAGLAISRSRRQYLRGHGMPENRGFEVPEYVFGACGAAPLYRREMLEDIELEGQYFDELFFAHKEDLDLSWRAQLYGWRCVYVPDAVAFHGRSFSPSARRHVPLFVRHHAVKNRYLAIIKNDLPELLLRDLAFIVWYDIRVMAYLLLFERSSMGAIVQVLRLLPELLRRRKLIMHNRRVTAEYMAQWFR